MAQMPTWSAHDLCAIGFIPLTCEGEVDPARSVIAHCALTAIRTIPRVTAEIIDEDPSGQAGVNCAYRRIPPQANGCSVELDACSRENPELWDLLGQAQVIYDPNDPEQIIGFEEIVDNSSSCGSCALDEASCKHRVALVAISNAMCGRERRQDFPLVARIFRSLTFEPSTQTTTRGRGFNARTGFVATAEVNEQFADPWGIDPRGTGVKACWSDILIPADTLTNNIGDINSLLTGCGCGECPEGLV